MVDYHPAKLFTLEEAKRTLPVVRAITRDMSALAHQIVERKTRLHYFHSRGGGDASDPYSEEMAAVGEQLSADVDRLNELADELRELGIEPKGAAEGLVDFPAEYEGRVVFLCWKLDEPQVAHWHEIEAGFAGRRVIHPEQWCLSANSETVAT